MKKKKDKYAKQAASSVRRNGQTIRVSEGKADRYRNLVDIESTDALPSQSEEMKESLEKLKQSRINSVKSLATFDGALKALIKAKGIS